MNLLLLYRKARRLMENKGIVLMYHRVADLLVDPFELSVSTDNFEQHLQILKRRFNVLSTEEMVYCLQKQKLPANAVCLTFDDGYEDNYSNALPLLEKYHCKATFYITTGLVGQSTMYWWDELQYIFLHTPVLPSKLSIRINGELIEGNLENNGRLSTSDWTECRNWKFENVINSQRCNLFKTIWSKLKVLPHEHQQKVLKELKMWARLPAFFEMGHLPMTNEQLKDSSKHPLISLGIHTHTHPSLTLCDNNRQDAEIVTCKRNLQFYHTQSSQTISYPFGEFNDFTLDIAKKEKIVGGFTTNEQIVTKRTNPLKIGRFQVKNWTGPVFQYNLDRWLSAK